MARIWLTKASTENLQFTEKAPSHMEANLNGIRVEKENGIEPYANVYTDLMDPTRECPAFPKGSIRRVTFDDTYYTGFRTDGLYVLKGATARVQTHRHVDRTFGNNDQIAVDVRQKISISARSIDGVRRIYSAIRRGELQPTEAWGDPNDVVL